MNTQLKVVAAKRKVAKKPVKTAKKAVKKALLAGKKEQYTRDNADIKKLDRGARAAARKKLKTSLKERHTTLLRQLPATGRLGFNALDQLISKIRGIKW